MLLNRWLVAEILLRAGVHIENKTRATVNVDHYWKALDLVKQVLMNTNKEKNDPKTAENRVTA